MVIRAEIVRVKGISKASKKMSRDAKEGVVVVSGDNKKTSIIEVNCETDFVAKNDDFVFFVKELSELNDACMSDLEKLQKANMKNGKTGLRKNVGGHTTCYILQRTNCLTVNRASQLSRAEHS